MINDFFNNPEMIWPLLKLVFIILFFLYIIIYSVLQVRQLIILQDKVRTSVDFANRIVGIIYILIQVLIFVLVLLLLP